MNYPTVVIETPLGSVRLTANSSTSCSVRQADDEKGLTINNVAYSVNLHSEPKDGVWSYATYENGRLNYTSLSLTRMDWATSGHREASSAARHKAETILFAAINEYMAEHPEFLDAGEELKLVNDLSRQTQKRKEARLLMEEAQKQMDETRAALYALVNDTKRAEYLKLEQDELAKEKHQRNFRDISIQYRHVEIADSLAVTEGRRGADNRYLTLDEIDRLAKHFIGIGDPVGEYLKTHKFDPSAGQCFEVPLTNLEAIMLDHWEDFTK